MNSDPVLGCLIALAGGLVAWALIGLACWAAIRWWWGG